MRAAEPDIFTVRPLADTLAQALARARDLTPYLERCAVRAPEAAARLLVEGPEALLEESLADAAAAAKAPLAEGMVRLRVAKRTMHLATAVADLAGHWPLERVTGALSLFADAAVTAAERLAAAELVRTRELAEAPLGGIPGLILLAMGKHGAGELNYSSDVDISVFFEPQRLPAAPGREPARVAVRLAQTMVRVLEEITAEGYVFRTDLRLRPDPGATPIAVSVPAALNYYQSLGQNWERAAFLKARPVAGDQEAASRFLDDLAPFRWRRGLDYAALDDILAVKRQIRAAKDKSELDDPAFDAKLGRGGIRDIEFFVQTQQLILAGRNPALRAPGTLAALDLLVEHGHVEPRDRDTLAHAYRQLRALEHRAQMVEDLQTHAVPADPEARGRLAALCGHDDLARFDAGLAALRQSVAAIDAKLFPARTITEAPLYDFTGVDDDPDTVERLSALGFADPGTVCATARAWRAGRVRAMRSLRAQELLTPLMPTLLEALAATGEPDLAFRRFADFFAGLPAGVQTLSLFTAHPQLLRELSEVLALAPGLAAALARQRGLLDAMIEPRFQHPLDADPPGTRRAAMAAAIGAAKEFEHALNAARRLQHEEAFRIDLHTLQGRASPEAAGAAHADLAEACIAGLAEAALAETTRRFGPAPGPVAVLGLGKLGGRELAQGSDLDLMVVYDLADPGAPASAGDFFARFTQRLITALSSPTEEGLLYAVDMQLRPSGSKGPVAVRLSSFQRYYAEEAWTWELLALTRARPAAGDPRLCALLEAEVRTLLARARDPTSLRADAAAMRARMDRERPGLAPWDLKLAPGGLVDVEFIAQTLTLLTLPSGADVLRPNTGEALAALVAAGALPAQEGARLGEAWRLFSRLQHWLRLVDPGRTPRPADMSQGLKGRLATTAGAEDFQALEIRLATLQAEVRSLFARLIGPLGDGSAPIAR